MAQSKRPTDSPIKIKEFDRAKLDRSVIAIPLLEEMRKDPRTVRSVIIDVNLDYPKGRDEAKAWISKEIPRLTGKKKTQGLREEKTRLSNQYVFARLDGKTIKALVRQDESHAEAEAQAAGQTRTAAVVPASPSARKLQGERVVIEADTTQSAYRFRTIYRIWPDFKIGPCITKSLSTVKADAAQSSFSAYGVDIAWAIMDSGIDAKHPHFQKHKNIDPNSPLHADFTDGASKVGEPTSALIDGYGHGTHVAGIIAGEQNASDGDRTSMRAVTRSIKDYQQGRPPTVETHEITLERIRGMAPQCKLVSLKVLDADGDGEVSNLIAAIAHIQEKNGYGRRILIHGVNISLGYDFDPEWFACGQSPLCVEIDRLARSGVVVVVAAGNTGYGALAAQQRTTNAGMEVTINDPGNADLAITVGSTHRDMPHLYGVSYFSSKGPTGDGRLKPDLVAPGEKILSAGAGKLLQEKAESHACEYVEDSGTSMAAPHVSGVIAAFLSVRREFIGFPERVKQIFLATATDLKRDRYFQGAGLIDLMRAIQSV